VSDERVKMKMFHYIVIGNIGTALIGAIFSIWIVVLSICAGLLLVILLEILKSKRVKYGAWVCEFEYDEFGDVKYKGVNLPKLKLRPVVLSLPQQQRTQVDAGIRMAG